MSVEELKKKLAGLERQRAQFLDGAKQLEGAIGFCKGLLKEAEDAVKSCPTCEPQTVSTNVPTEAAISG